MKTLEKFWNEFQAWSDSQFVLPASRGPAGPLKHLAKEVQECLANPADLEEYADLQFLVFDAARRAGFSYQQLVKACFAKLEKNRHRTWPATTSEEPVEHVRDDDISLGTLTHPATWPCPCCGQNAELEPEYGVENPGPRLCRQCWANEVGL